MKRTSIVQVIVGSIGLIILVVLLLPALPHQHSAQSDACVNNLRQIQFAKEYFAEAHGYMTNAVISFNRVLTPDQLSTNYIGGGFQGLRCPQKGIYSINRLSEVPTCDFAAQDKRHALEQRQ